MTALGPCAICTERPATDVCPDFVTVGPLCGRCHAARRTAFQCPCMTIMQALSLTSSTPEETRAALERGAALQRPEDPAMASKKKKPKSSSTNGHAPTPTAAELGEKPIERARYEELVLVKIAPEDVAAKASELADVIDQRLQLKDRRREANAQFREKLAYLDEREAELSEAVRQKSERRPVLCIEQLVPRLHKVQVVRSDTGEIVSERAATPEDMQEGLPGVDGGKKAKKARPAPESPVVENDYDPTKPQPTA